MRKENSEYGSSCRLNQAVNSPAQHPFPLPELLAPAGAIESFWAGFQAGADAFYLGAREFNARKRAKNFSHNLLRDVVLFSHRHGKKVYCTVNTLIFDGEIRRLVSVLELLEEISIDAVIVQDLGVVELIRTYFPLLRMHASTQLFCHNAQQARFLAELGVSRIIFPRELSLDEMASIMAEVPLEYEAFVHGALCFSFSGCCLFSSHLFGASANRGECRQPCRHAVEVDGQGCYPFSMRDIQTLDILPQILGRLRLASLKIEGRLRNAAYVGKVVAAYRAALDAIRNSHPAPEPLPSIDGQRTTTRGFWFGTSYELLVERHSAATIGEEVGRVSRLGPGFIEFRIQQAAHKGERLSLHSSDGKRLFHATLLDFSNIDGHIIWRIKHPFGNAHRIVGCRIYRTAHAPTKTLGEKGERRIRHEASLVKTVPIDVMVTCLAATSHVRIEARFCSEGISTQWEYPVQLSSDSGLAWSAGLLESIMRRVDTTPFDVRFVKSDWPTGLWCRLSQLKAIRRSFYAALNAWYRSRTAQYHRQRRSEIERELAVLQRQYAGATQQLPRLFSSTISSFPPKNIGHLIACDVRLSGYVPLSASACVVLRPPLFISQGTIEKWKTRIRKLVAKGYRQWIAPTYGWIPLLRAEGVDSIIAGPFLYAVNSFAVRLLKKFRVERFVLSSDIDESLLGAVARFKGRLQEINETTTLCVTRLPMPLVHYRLGRHRLAVVDYGEYREVHLCGEVGRFSRDITYDNYDIGEDQDLA